MDISINPDSPDTYIKILQQNGINSPIKDVSIKVPSMAGDQFASQCKLVTVVFADETKPPLDLFVKAAITTGDYAEQMKDVLMFEKEALYFSKLLPEMEEFAKAQNGYDGFLAGLLPKCYFANENLIVFENLLSKGYVMLNKLVHHDLHTAETVILNMAKFHGIALAFFQHIGEDKFLSKYSTMAAKSFFSEAGETICGAWLQSGVDGAIKILSTKPTPGSDKALEYIKQYENRGFLRLCELLRLDNQSCSMSLNHGDLWNGNVMFKDNAESKLHEKCVIIDLQTIHLGSPALDVLFYLFTSVDKEVRSKEWKKLLHIYYDHLEEVVVRKLGKQLKFSFEDLMSDFRIKFDAGFLFGMYSVFGYEALANIEDNAMTDGDAMENLTSTMITALDRSMERRGRTFSENIVKMYAEVLEITLGQNN